MVPFLLPVLLAANVALAAWPGAARGYQALLAAQAAFYLLALAGARGPRWFPMPRAARLAYYLLAMNAAFVAGLVRVLAGRDQAVWRHAEEAASGTI